MQRNGRSGRKIRMRGMIPFNRQVFLGAAALVVTAVLLIIGLYPRNAVAPDVTDTAPPETMADAAGTQVSTLVEAGCELVQQMTYSRCGHTITRRIPLPQELAGKTLRDVEAAYEGWQVTEFLPKRITMSRLFPLYCAQHVVLMPDESGMLAVYQNKYGDAMVFVQSLETSLASLPESLQEEIRQGKGFDSMGGLEEWLENMES